MQRPGDRRLPPTPEEVAQVTACPLVAGEPFRPGLLAAQVGGPLLGRLGALIAGPTMTSVMPVITKVVILRQNAR